MLESGNYELKQSLITSRSGAITSRARLEALAMINEFPEGRAGELPLLALVLCGDTDDTAYQLPNVIFRPAYLDEHRSVEKMNLEDALQYKRTGTPSIRFQLAQRTRWIAAEGSAVIIDLGYEPTFPASTTAFAIFDNFNLIVHNLMYEHAGVVDDTGYLAAGLVQLIIDNALRHGNIGTPFAHISLYEAMTYNTPEFADHATGSASLSSSQSTRALRRLNASSSASSTGARATSFGCSASRTCSASSTTTSPAS